MTARRAGFTGSREYEAQHAVREAVAALPRDAIVVVGGWWLSHRMVATPTRGVDSYVVDAASRDHIVVLVMGPEGAGSSAGLMRNPVTVALSDDMTAFVGPCHDLRCTNRAPHSSHGTKRTVNLALAAGKPVRIFGPGGREEIP